MHSILSFVFGLVIPLCSCFADIVSKACYGSGGPRCAFHNLRCSPGRIAIQEAFYTNSDVCGDGVVDCTNFNVSSIPLTGTRYNFTDKRLDSLYRICSTKPSCSLQADRTMYASFSAIIYQCVNETIDMCNVTNILKKETSLIWRGPSDHNTCVCSISEPKTSSTMLTLRALDLRHRCQVLTFSGIGNADPLQCSNFDSHQLLYNSTNWIDVKMFVNNTNPNTNIVVWIGIHATDNLSIVCKENPTSEPVEATPRLSPTPSRPSSVVPPDQTTITKIGTEKVSKACYGTPWPCAHHKLTCSSGRIAVQEAFFVNGTACPTPGIQNCSLVNVSSILLNGTRHHFGIKEKDELYGNCSTKPNCSFQAQRSPKDYWLFSAIIYQCINETIDMCNVTDIQRITTSLMLRGPSDQSTCMCSISKPSTIEPQMLALTVLEMRQHCPAFTISVPGITVPLPCEKFTSHRLLLNSTEWINISMTINTTNIKSFIWIGVQGSELLNIMCNLRPTTTEAATTIGLPIANTTTKMATIGTTQLGSSSVVQTGQTTKDILTEEKSTTGTLIGTIIPLGIIIAGVVTAVIIFRRRKLRQRGENRKGMKHKSKPNVPYSLEKKSSPPPPSSITSLNLVPKTRKLRSPQYEDSDDDCYHQVEPLQTRSGLTESNQSGGFKSDKLHFQMPKNGSPVRDCADGYYHELKPQTDLGLSEDNMAPKMESHNVKKQPLKKRLTEYVSAGNISNKGNEPQQARKGTSDYDHTGGNDYHVLERQLALKDSSNYDYAEGNNYQEKEPQVSNSSDYDYATCVDKQANHSSSMNTQTRDSDYDHIGQQPTRPNGHYDTTVLAADLLKGGNDKEEVYSYNHLNEKTSGNANVDSTYNTTASTRHNLDASSNDTDDDYGYNHLGTDSKKNLPQNEYDTTASAIRDLARMNGDIEDSTYDHAHLLTSDSSPSGMTNAGFQESGYDHTSPTATAHKDRYESNASRNRSHQEEGVAGAGEADTNPYQLAK